MADRDGIELSKEIKLSKDDGEFCQRELQRWMDFEGECREISLRIDKLERDSSIILSLKHWANNLHYVEVMQAKIKILRERLK